MSQLTSLDGLYWDKETLDPLILSLTRLKQLHLELRQQKPFTQLQQLNTLSNLEHLVLFDGPLSEMNFEDLHLPNLKIISLNATTEGDLTALVHLTRLTNLDTIMIALNADLPIRNGPCRLACLPNLTFFSITYEGLSVFEPEFYSCCIPASYDMTSLDHFSFNARHSIVTPDLNYSRS